MKTIVTFFRTVVLTSLGASAVSQAAANLVINGDFEAGSTGFTSTYVYADPLVGTSPITHNSNLMWDEGTYTVGKSVNATHQYWTFGPFGDHTTGTGNMLIVNGSESTQLGSVWSGTLTDSLTTGTYSFSAWAANVYNQAPSTLRFFIGGVQIGSDFTLGTAGQWVRFSASFTVPPVPAGNPSFTDLIVVHTGNDFVVDDISLVAVPEPTTMIAGALLLLPLGVGLARKFRKA